MRVQSASLLLDNPGALHLSIPLSLYNVDSKI